jgi:hypothetical protein
MPVCRVKFAICSASLADVPQASALVVSVGQVAELVQNFTSWSKARIMLLRSGRSVNVATAAVSALLLRPGRCHRESARWWPGPRSTRAAAGSAVGAPVHWAAGRATVCLVAAPLVRHAVLGIDWACCGGTVVCRHPEHRGGPDHEPHPRRVGVGLGSDPGDAAAAGTGQVLRVSPSDTCRIVAPQAFRAPRTVSKHDVFSMVELAKLMPDLTADLDVVGSGEGTYGVGDVTEFAQAARRRICARSRQHRTEQVDLHACSSGSVTSPGLMTAQTA